MRISKWIKPLCFGLLLCILNFTLTFLMEPLRGSSGTMWEEYYMEDELDMIFVGASFCSAASDPYIFNEKLGVKSFNMGTPLQGIEQNVSAIKTALEDHDIKTIVVNMGFFVLQMDSIDQAELSFENMKARKNSGVAGIYDGLRYMWHEEVRNTEKSINYLFPWLYNQEDVSWEFISKNVASKIDALKNGTDEKIVSRKGYRYYLGEEGSKTKWEINSFRYYPQELDSKLVAEFEELLALCSKEDVDVIVVNTPHPVYDVVSCYETYEKNEELVTELCAKYEIDYYNFSLAKPEIFDVKTAYFYDFEHLNDDGAKVFSTDFCEFLERRAIGEDMSKYFYSVEEFLSMHGSLLEEWKEVQ